MGTGAPLVKRCPREPLPGACADLNSNVPALHAERGGACGVSELTPRRAHEKLGRSPALAVNAQARVKQVLLKCSPCRTTSETRYGSNGSFFHHRQCRCARNHHLAGFDSEMLMCASFSVAQQKPPTQEDCQVAWQRYCLLNDWAPCAGSCCWKSLSHRQQSGTRSDQNYSPLLWQAQHIGCRSRSDGTCSPCDPADDGDVASMPPKFPDVRNRMQVMW